MNKKEAINELIKKIYNTSSDLILPEVDIKMLNDFFKRNENFDKNFVMITLRNLMKYQN